MNTPQLGGNLELNGPNAQDINKHVTHYSMPMIKDKHIKGENSFSQSNESKNSQNDQEGNLKINQSNDQNHSNHTEKRNSNVELHIGNDNIKNVNHIKQKKLSKSHTILSQEEKEAMEKMMLFTPPQNGRRVSIQGGKKVNVIGGKKHSVILRRQSVKPKTIPEIGAQVDSIQQIQNDILGEEGIEEEIKTIKKPVNDLADQLEMQRKASMEVEQLLMNHADMNGLIQPRYSRNKNKKNRNHENFEKDVIYEKTDKMNNGQKNNVDNEFLGSENDKDSDDENSQDDENSIEREERMEQRRKKLLKFNEDEAAILSRIDQNALDEYEEESERMEKLNNEAYNQMFAAELKSNLDFLNENSIKNTIIYYFKKFFIQLSLSFIFTKIGSKSPSSQDILIHPNYSYREINIFTNLG